MEFCKFEARTVGQTVHKGKCDFCFLDKYGPEGLYLCLECDCCVCSEHLPLHTGKTGHMYFARIKYTRKQKDAPAQEPASLIDDYDMAYDVCSTDKTVLTVANCPIYSELKSVAERLAFAEEDRFVSKRPVCTSKGLEEVVLRCEHVDKQIAANTGLEDALPKISKDGAQCSCCDIKENLWLCLTCGHLGCGRKQIGCVGNGHALKHFQETGHPLTVKLGTVGAGRKPDYYCYQCNFDPSDYTEEEKMLKLIGFFGLSLTGETTEKSLTQIEEDVTKKLAMQSSLEGGNDLALVRIGNTTGICNVGCTCYASAATQAVNASILRLNQQITFSMFIEHWKDCMYQDMRSCLRCQEYRLLAALSSYDPRDPRAEYIKPDCGDLIPLICPHFAYERGTLQDASELLLNWTQRSPILRQKCGKTYVKKVVFCNQCHSRYFSKEELPGIIGLGLNNVDVRLLIDDYFKPTRMEGKKCSFCEAIDGIGGCEITCKTELMSAPDILLIQPLRAVYTTAGVVKIEDDLTIPMLLDLSGYKTCEYKKDEQYEDAWQIRAAIEASNAESRDPKTMVNDEMLANLLAIGIGSQEICRAALLQTHNNFEVAADLILSGGVILSKEGRGSSDWVTDKKESDDIMGVAFSGPSPRYELWCFVTHQGSSPQAGHYVCHTRLLPEQVENAELETEDDKPESLEAHKTRFKNMKASPADTWVVLNDTRVAISEKPPIGAGFVYAFVRTQ